MMNPCYDYCYLRFGKQYTEDCDSRCAFAQTAKELKQAKKEINRLKESVPHICAYCVGCEIESKDGHGCDGDDSFILSISHLAYTLKNKT